MTSGGIHQPKKRQVSRDIIVQRVENMRYQHIDDRLQKPHEKSIMQNMAQGDKLQWASIVQHVNVVLIHLLIIMVCRCHQTIRFVLAVRMRLEKSSLHDVVGYVQDVNEKHIHSKITEQEPMLINESNQ
jgi:hypothetical protein